MQIKRRDYSKGYYEHFLYKEIPYSQRNKKRLKEILEIKKVGRLLEIGCGEGGLLKLASKYFDVEGIDISKYAINSLKPIFGDKVKAIDIRNANLKHNYFDAIIIFNVLEHLKDPYPIAKKIYECINKNGLIMGSVPNYSLGVGILFTWFVNTFIDSTHYSIYPPNYWYNLFKRAGFKKINFYGEFILNRNMSSYIKNKFWKYVSCNLIFICKK